MKQLKETPYVLSNSASLSAALERALKPGDTFKECHRLPRNDRRACGAFPDGLTRRSGRLTTNIRSTRSTIAQALRRGEVRADVRRMGHLHYPWRLRPL